MRTHPISSAITVIMIATQFLGLATVWAIEGQRGVPLEGTQGLVTGLSGAGDVHAGTATQTPRPLTFLDRVAGGEQITVGPGTVTEILWGTRALITVTGPAQVRVSEETPGQTVVQLDAGIVRLATAASALGPEETVLLQTPTAKVRTHGGVLRSTVASTLERASPASGPDAAHTMLVAMTTQNLFAASSGLIEMLHVDEGRAELIVSTPGSAPVMLEQGQSVRLLGGQVGAPSQSVPTAAEQGGPLTLAVAQHAKTPAAGTENMVTQQRAQAQALQRAMLGTEEVDEVKMGESGNKDVILPTTQGVNLPGGTQNLLRSLGAPGLVGGPVASVRDALGDTGFFPEAEQTSNTNIQRPNGGGGLLLFDRSLVTMDGSKNNGNQSIQIGYTPFNTELFLVDGGSGVTGPLNAPHRGQLPDERLTVSGLVGSDPSGETLFEGQPGRTLFLTIPNQEPLPSSEKPVVFTRLVKDPSEPRGLEFSETPFNNKLIGILETFASSPDVIPGGSSNARERSAAIFRERNFKHTAGVNGVIRARSIGSESVTSAGGVVLNNNTHVTAPSTAATSTYFTQQGDINSSIVAVIGRNFDLRIQDTDSDDIPDHIAIEGGALNPAKVVLKDRALAVLGGSSITPASGGRVSLLSILDSQLTGPSGPPRLLPGDTQPAEVPAGFVRNDVPPLIEVINSGTAQLQPNNPNFKNAVDTHSAIVVRAELDQALLIASAPLISLINGTMRTTGDLINVSGPRTHLTATIPNDQILLAGVQLNKSVLNVGGHLFNVTGGATASVTGNLVALSEGSTLNLTGALVNVGPGSSFTLQGGSLIAFGVGANTVNVMTGIPNSCGGCTPRTIPNLTGIPVLAHPTATLDIHPEFVPIAGAGAGTVAVGGGSQSFSNTVNNESGAPLIQVGLGGKLTLGR